MEDSIEHLKRILENESPILFTGAGFNYGAKTSKNLEIPNGSKLKEIIIKDLLGYKENSEEYNQLIKSSLQEVSQYAQDQTNKNRFNDYLEDFFIDIQPAEYHFKLTCYPWRKIYTTNIDDLVENVYRINKKELVRENMARASTKPKHNATQYFKLHGCVNNKPEGFTFSSEEYIDSIIQTEDFRFTNLKLDMNNESIIFLGTNFNEFNIDYYLKIYENVGYESSRGKLFFVNPNPGILFENKVNQYNGILIKWTAEQFLNFLEEESNLKNDNTKVEFINAYKSGFLQLDWLKNKLKNSLDDYYSYLYEGNQPRWEDIFSDWDIEVDLAKREFKNFLETIDEKNYGVFSLYGKAFSGKSTVLKRISNQLLNEKYEVIYFEGRDFDKEVYKRLEKTIINSEKRPDKIALIIDNASYYYYSIREVLKNLPKNTKLVIVTASRTIQHSKYRYVLIDYNLNEFEMPTKINDEYANKILEKLDEKGFLGILQQYKSKEEKINYIKKENDILSVLFQITHGKGFIKRYQKELFRFLENKSTEKDLLVNLVIFEELGLPFFPKELVTDFYKEKKTSTINNVLNFIKQDSKGDYSLRTNFFNEKILRQTTEEQLLKQIKEILISISPLVNVERHNYWNEIHASLTRTKTLRELKIRPRKALKMLYSIRNYYKDNFHYWVQLGIAESNSGEFDKATNHFKQAEALVNSFIVKSAMGTNYMKKAVNLNDSFEAEPFLKEGEKILTKLIDETLEFEITSYTTHSFICQKLKYLQKFKTYVTHSELNQMLNYSKYLMDKDPYDFFTKDTRFRLYNYLKSIGKENLMKIELHELKQFYHEEKKQKGEDASVSDDDLAIL